MRFDYGAGEVEIIVSPWTLLVYEQEFHSDMIQDVLGKVIVRNEEEDEETVTVFDYRNVNWTSYVKALWACMKAADDGVKPFREWSSNVGNLNILEVSSKLTPILEEGLFHSGGTASA